MACHTCNSTAPLTTFDVQYFYSNQCFDCGDGSCAKVSNAKCIVYTGPNLSCSGISTNDNLETALQKIDEQICSVIGDYSNYQFNCLTAWWGAPITMESEFVDAITGYACETRSNLNTFIDTTYEEGQAALDVRISNLEVPGITCAIAGVGPTDTLEQVLNKYCTAFSTFNDYLNLSSVVWDGCMIVGTSPTTIQEGFQLLADQICAVNTGFELPTINNIGTCLASPGATDSIVATIGKINDYMCDLPTFDVDDVTWGCLDEQINLQDTVNLLVAQATARLKEVASYSGDFTITQVDEMDPCAGINVALTTPLNTDRFVAVSAGDAAPGTLIDKIASSGNTLTVTNDADTTLNVEIADGDKGDVTVAGNTWGINNEAVTYDKIQNVTSERLLGRSTAGVGVIEEISVGTGLTLAGGILSAENTLSGTFTPTLVNTTNITDSTAYPGQYMRVGDVVTVSGRVAIRNTADALATTLEMTLPVASDFANIYEAAGTAYGNAQVGSISAATTSNGVQLNFVSNADTTTLQYWYYHYTYQVIVGV